VKGKLSGHWMDNPDPNIYPAGRQTKHAGCIRMSAQTILNLLSLKAKLEGRKLDILAEAQAFERQNQ
jgi:hypothetical protein